MRLALRAWYHAGVTVISATPFATTFEGGPSVPRARASTTRPTRTTRTTPVASSAATSSSISAATTRPTARPTARHGLRAATITPAMLAEVRALAEPRWSADGTFVYYLESHDGRGALFRVLAAGGPALRITSDPPAAPVASYSGGFYSVSRDAVAYQAADRSLYRIPAAGGRASKIPTGAASISISAPVFSPDGSQIAFVADDGITADIGIVDSSGDQWPRKVPVDADFAADPVWSPDGRFLAWAEWSVPHMGWDESRIVICDLRTGERRVVMGEPETSAAHPQWSPDGRTFSFMCDRNGYMNLWRAAGDGSDPRPWVQEPFDQASPLWGSGQSCYTWSPDGAQIAYLRHEDGTHRLRLLDVATGATRAIGEADRSYASLRWAPRGGDLLAVTFGPTVPPAVVVIDTHGGGGGGDGGGSGGDGHQRTLATTALGGLTGGHSSIAPRPIAWRGAGELEVYGLLYEPVGLAAGERPPLLVSVHGGPTGQSSALWSPVIQYFLQRGWAVFAPNARGSAGYGRAYIQALQGEWGGADMADIAAGIEHVTGQGWADPARVVVWGGSAGGYAVLLLPALYPHLFKAAVSLFGVSDLFSLARTTHRLEAHYLDRIVGPLPEASERYRERSPVSRAARYGCPVLMLQGDQDVAVTPDQAEMMREAFARAGKTAILHLYPGEGHGWQRAATVRDYVERMDRFLEEYALLR